MKLVSLQVVGLGDLAWSSKKLVFGDRFTQLYGPNGCGKTPMVQSIAFALGYKVEFRDDILERADRVVLEVDVAGKRYTLTRRLKGSFDVTVEEQNGSGAAEFISEREYSRFLLSLWGLEDPVLTTVRDESTHIYSTQIIPLFYLDQNHGYAVDYYLPVKYIKNQYAEAMRLVFGLTPKHSYDKRRAKNELKEKLEYLDRAVVRFEKLIEELTEDLAGERRGVSDIDRELDEAVSGLDALRESKGSVEQVNVELENRIGQLQQQSHSLARERSELESRVRGFGQIRHEIEVEADTLLLNEEARRVFASFDAICANANCGLFVRSSATYGKSLLYLKDQIKDLERTNAAHERRISELNQQMLALSELISSARRERERASQKSSTESLVEVVSQLTERVIQLRRAKQTELELLKVETQYVEKLDERARMQVRLSEMDGQGGAADLELLRVRNALAERIKYWLTVL